MDHMKNLQIKQLRLRAKILEAKAYVLENEPASKEVKVPRESLKQVFDILENLEDRGPTGSTWQSTELAALVDLLRKKLLE